MIRIFTAIFCAGIVSLMLELSLLREFVYVIGSSAFSNSLIISVFLAGLAIGTYVGLWKRFKSKKEKDSRRKFALLEASLLIFVLLFYTTKDYFVYISPHQWLVIGYFILVTFIPSFIAGAAYTTIIELLYHKGERYIIYIYAISTLGNVIGGLLYGYVFVYLFGQQSAYVFAVLCTTVTVLLIHPFVKKSNAVIFILVAFVIAWIIKTNSINERLYRFDDLLFRRYSPSGLVEIWRTPDGEAIEMTVNNVHEYYSYGWDKSVHAQWAETTLEAVGDKADVLLLGYGSGVSSAAYLSSSKTTSVDTVENTGPVLEAGEIYFPEEYKVVITDPRSRVIMKDFRNYIRFTEKKYDIVLLDHSIIDPYYSGFFTLEFFDQVKNILKPGGVVASLGVGLSYDTIRQAFPYIYRYTTPGRELISDSGFFLTTMPLGGDAALQFTPEGPESGGEPVYSDRRVRGASVNTALKAIKPRVSRSIF
ncbi:fused MFS/spermidine synthase [Candidatus Gottesmanbacteria bacterium]|nr:fused MFS/spermidine synthase [Candidatus Gottesmanbacteria bacterium]